VTAIGRPGAVVTLMVFRRRFVGQGMREDLVSFEAVVPARGEWKACVEVHPVIEGKVIDPRYLCGQPVDRSAPAERLARWRRQVPQVETDHEGLRAVLTRGSDALGALRILIPTSPSASC
jgi:hypothetical protein